MMMRSYIAAFIAGATASLLPRDWENSECHFQIWTYGGAEGSVGQIYDGQNRIGGGYPPATYVLKGDQIYDSQGRGCILTPPTGQWQCDAGAPGTPGASIGHDGAVMYNGSPQFYACPVNDYGEWNIYNLDNANPGKCVPISINTHGQCTDSYTPPPPPNYGSQPPPPPPSYSTPDYGHEYPPPPPPSSMPSYEHEYPPAPPSSTPSYEHEYPPPPPSSTPSYEHEYPPPPPPPTTTPEAPYSSPPPPPPPPPPSQPCPPQQSYSRPHPPPPVPTPSKPCDNGSHPIYHPHGSKPPYGCHIKDIEIEDVEDVTVTYDAEITVECKKCNWADENSQCHHKCPPPRDSRLLKHYLDQKEQYDASEMPEAS